MAVKYHDKNYTQDNFTQVQNREELSFLNPHQGHTKHTDRLNFVQPFIFNVYSNHTNLFELHWTRI